MSVPHRHEVVAAFRERYWLHFVGNLRRWKKAKVIPVLSEIQSTERKISTTVKIQNRNTSWLDKVNNVQNNKITCMKI